MNQGQNSGRCLRWPSFFITYNYQKENKQTGTKEKSGGQRAEKTHI